MTVIDSHQHVWDPRRAAYDWLGPAMAPVDRVMRFTDVRPALRDAGVTAGVLVQAADNDADTDLMPATAAAHPEVVAVVARVPLDNSVRARQRLTELRRDPHVAGVRALVHDNPDRDWILRPDVARGLDLLAEAGLTPSTTSPPRPRPWSTYRGWRPATPACAWSSTTSASPRSAAAPATGPDGGG
ncbi:hypothetical protein GCM10010145_60710 [Streptomyces ruber]|uniref:Amidohydrolase-related domain-containing protein n=2 Tax=Streptomyces TaxID=1883 RepID=A0A918BQ50_9ACTN|nr:amidohydrolase family protein [Streptomyces ruber]GGQ82933.1 hypothetical protein GCM10010145_60710 [Streptomyces ruber]